MMRSITAGQDQALEQETSDLGPSGAHICLDGLVHASTEDTCIIMYILHLCILVHLYLSIYESVCLSVYLSNLLIYVSVNIHAYIIYIHMYMKGRNNEGSICHVISIPATNF